jgi:hypothetical protein
VQCDIRGDWKEDSKLADRIRALKRRLGHYARP